MFSESLYSNGVLGSKKGSCEYEDLRVVVKSTATLFNTAIIYSRSHPNGAKFAEHRSDTLFSSACANHNEYISLTSI